MQPICIEKKRWKIGGLADWQISRLKYYRKLKFNGLFVFIVLKFECIYGGKESPRMNTNNK
jgi:hypothetical protein